MDKYIQIALMSATAATSVAVIAHFIQRYHLQRLHKEIQGAGGLLSEITRKTNAFEAEMAELEDEIRAFKTHLTEIHYGGVEVTVITGPEFAPEKLEEMTADVIAAISKHIPEAHAFEAREFGASE